MNPGIKIIDGEEYINSKMTCELIGRSNVSDSFRKLIIKEKLEFIEYKNMVWIKKSSITKYNSYKKELDQIQRNLSEKRKFFKQEYEQEYKQAQIQKNNLEQNYFSYENNKLTNHEYLTIQGFKVLYNPILFKRINDFKLSNFMQKKLKKLPIFFIGDIVHLDNYYRLHDLVQCQLKYILSKYELTFKAYDTPNWHWPSPKLIEEPFHFTHFDKIDAYIARRKKEQVEIEKIIQQSKPSYDYSDQ